jgi:hypothetical protein
MTYSIKQLNKAAAAHDLELVKGSGYFYWVHPTQFPPSVYVNSFNECTKEILKDRVKSGDLPEIRAVFWLIQHGITVTKARELLS